MATTLINSHPKYTWLFLAVRRSDMQDRPHRLQINAPDYLTARKIISGDYIAAFAGRIPCISGSDGINSLLSADKNHSRIVSPEYTPAP